MADAIDEYYNKLIRDIQQALDDRDFHKLARLAEQVAMLGK